LQSARLKFEKLDDSPKSEPDHGWDSDYKNRIKLFWTKSMQVNRSEKMKSGNPNLKVDCEKTIKNLKFSQRHPEPKSSEVPLRLLDSWEILKNISTQRKEFSDKLDWFIRIPEDVADEEKSWKEESKH
jgi:hypothetical protein